MASAAAFTKTGCDQPPYTPAPAARKASRKPTKSLAQAWMSTMLLALKRQR